MNHFWLPAFLFYLVIGTIVCSYAKDRDGKPMPVHHFMLLVFFWPLLFILDEDDP
jgi:hypothetical protein